MQNLVILESVLGTGHRFLEMKAGWIDQLDYRTQKTAESAKSISDDGLASSIDWDSIVYLTSVRMSPLSGRDTFICPRKGSV